MFFNHRIVGRVFRMVATLGIFMLAGLIISELMISAEPRSPVDSAVYDSQGADSHPVDLPETKPSVVDRVDAERDTL